jgi:hypothetical protein
MKNPGAAFRLPAKIILLSVIFLCFFSGPLTAYLDPGTGSYMLQLLIAGVASALLAIRVFWNNITVFFKKIFKRGKKGGN